MASAALLIAGSTMVAYGPPLGLALFLFTFHPLIILSLVGSMFALPPLLVTSLGFLILEAASGISSGLTDISAAHFAIVQDKQWIILLVGFFFKEIFRVLLCFSILISEFFFRKNNQSMLDTTWRLMPLGLAAGFGYATLLSLTTFGATLENEIYYRVLGKIDSDALVFNPKSCSKLPLVAVGAFSSLSFFIMHLAATVLTLQLVAVQFRKREPRPVSIVAAKESDNHLTVESHRSDVRVRIVSRLTYARRWQISLAMVVGWITSAGVSVIPALNERVLVSSKDGFYLDSKSSRGCAVVLPVQIALALICAATAMLLSFVERRQMFKDWRSPRAAEDAKMRFDRYLERLKEDEEVRRQQKAEREAALQQKEQEEQKGEEESEEPSGTSLAAHSIDFFAQQLSEEERHSVLTY